MHIMASDGETVLASDDETVLSAEHGEYALEGRRVWVKSLSLGERAETRDIWPRIKVRNVETQVVPPEYTRSIIENDMHKLWQSVQPLNASELLVELRGRAGEFGYDRAKDARHLMWQLKAEEEKAREAASEPNTTDTVESRLRDKWRTITRAEMPKARDDIVEAIAARKAEQEITADMTQEEKRILDGGERAAQPQIYPPPPPPKITTEEWQDIEDEGAWEDDMIEDDATNAQKKKKKRKRPWK